jgi:hypothetical protein
MMRSGERKGKKLLTRQPKGYKSGSEQWQQPRTGVLIEKRYKPTMEAVSSLQNRIALSIAIALLL